MADLNISFSPTETALNEQRKQSLNSNAICPDRFFPAVDLKALRLAMRIDSNITTERLKQACLAAIYQINDELAALSQASTEELNQHQRYHYLNAVYCLTAASLYERYASYDLTNDGEKRMAILDQSVDDLRRDARFSVRTLLGKRKITAALL